MYKHSYLRTAQANQPDQLEKHTPKDVVNVRVVPLVVAAAPAAGAAVLAER